MEVKELYLFNPFTIDQCSNQQLQETYTKLQEKIIDETDIPYQIASNIEIYSNMCYLIGEMISRLQEDYDNKKIEKEIKEHKNVYEARDKWIKEKTDKPPAMSYFEALSKETVQKEYEELARLNARLFRFKKAYDSCENKMNALKKKIESIKYEN